MALQAGIVGLPNVGKSTLFNALTAAKAEAANYPFCTIDPNVGVVTVPDPRIQQITQIIKPQKEVPTVMEFVDIAGLVAGAHKGEGLGNQFLQNIREVDAIVHVVRCFANDDVIHVSGSVDPLRDIETINTELILSDLDTVEKRLQRIEKQARTSKDKDLLLELEVLKKYHGLLAEGHPARQAVLNEQENEAARNIHLLSSKPVLYLCNVNEEEYLSGPGEHTQKVIALAQKEGSNCLSLCSSIEAEISLLPKDEQGEFLESLGVSEPGLSRLIRETYSLLGLITYFTAGEKEVRAWTITKGTKAPQAAGKIHTDFEKGFIRAETYNCADLFQLKSETAIREAGKYKSEGKDYVVKDGDVMLFRFNV